MLKESHRQISLIQLLGQHRQDICLTWDKLVQSNIHESCLTTVSSRDNC